jgi:hypothetical protein
MSTKITFIEDDETKPLNINEMQEQNKITFIDG